MLIVKANTHQDCVLFNVLMHLNIVVVMQRLKLM